MISLNDALQDVSRLAVDTAPIIYLVERNPRYVAHVRDVFARIHRGSITGYSSTITLTEVLTMPLRHDNQAIADTYRSVLLNSRNFFVLSISPSIAESAASLRAQYNLRTPDALQLAAAIEARCEAFLTNDLALRRITELKVIALDELTP